MEDEDWNEEQLAALDAAEAAAAAAAAAAAEAAVSLSLIHI